MSANPPPAHVCIRPLNAAMEARSRAVVTAAAGRPPDWRADPDPAGTVNAYSAAAAAALAGIGRPNDEPIPAVNAAVEVLYELLTSPPPHDAGSDLRGEAAWAAWVDVYLRYATAYGGLVRQLHRAGPASGDIPPAVPDDPLGLGAGVNGGRGLGLAAGLAVRAPDTHPIPDTPRPDPNPFTELRLILGDMFDLAAAKRNERDGAEYVQFIAATTAEWDAAEAAARAGCHEWGIPFPDCDKVLTAANRLLGDYKQVIYGNMDAPLRPRREYAVLRRLDVRF